jgi:hypothetical protein
MKLVQFVDQILWDLKVIWILLLLLPPLSFAVVVVAAADFLEFGVLQMPEPPSSLLPQELQELYQQQRLLVRSIQRDILLLQLGSYLLELVGFQERSALQTFVGSETAWVE